MQDAAMANWKRLEKLNGGEPIEPRTPRLDTKDEVWFYSAGHEFRVWSAGVLHKKSENVTTLPAPLSGRFTLYKLIEELFIDVEIRGDQAILRRGIPYGGLVSTVIASSEVEPLLVRYRRLGFRDGTPWNATSQRITLRVYHKGEQQKWEVHIDGDTVRENWREELLVASREAAIAHVEKRIRAKEQEGFQMTQLNVLRVTTSNPEPKPGEGELPRPVIPKQTVIAKPTNAYEAVDAAVAILRELHQRIPRGHFLAEYIDLETEHERITDIEEYEDIFLRLHKRRIGRWRTVKPSDPKTGESSWDYFARVYGSITWIIASEADDGLQMFYCGDVAEGGGRSCLEIDSDGLCDMDALAKENNSTEIKELFVFHGGGHHTDSFAFDQRVSSPTGERVSTLAKTVERNLREVN